MRIPTGSHTVETRVKNSRFRATAEPLEAAASAKARVEEIRAAHPGCAHVVYAFSVGPENERAFGMSDDGEPKGTAGRPVLDVLSGSGVTNCLVTVVRYFGGTKLGTGGLVHAYGGAAREVLNGVPTVPLVASSSFDFTVPYDKHDLVRRILAHFEAEVTTEEFTETVRVAGTLPRANAAACAAAIRDATSGIVNLE
jgi:uncharacterized YigZ family protein